MPQQVDRLSATFHGQVQGVGFRFTVRSLASSYSNITGLVRNLSDGTVELLAEGNRDTMDSLLLDIRSEMSPNISREDIVWSRGVREFTDFRIGF